MDPDPGAVDALPQTRDEGEHEEGEAPPHRPAVPTAQQAVVAHDEYGAEQHDADAGPHGLLGGVVVGLLQALVGQVQSLDHGQPEPVEGHGRGQEHRVGPRRGAPHPQVDDDGHGHERPAELKDLRRGGAGAVQRGQDEAAQAQDQGDDEKTHLGPATGTACSTGCDRGCLSRMRCRACAAHRSALQLSGATGGGSSTAAEADADGVAVGVGVVAMCVLTVTSTYSRAASREGCVTAAVRRSRMRSSRSSSAGVSYVSTRWLKVSGPSCCGMPW